MDPTLAHPPTLPPVAGPDAPRRIRWWIGLMVLAGVGLLAVIGRFEPSGQPFFPRCWLYQTTGLQCPGCGATRALHALLNGDLRRALQLNALVVFALPVAGWLALRGLHGCWTGRWWPNPVTHPASLAALGGLLVGFGLARNLPW